MSAWALYGQTAPTQISDTIIYPNGTKPSGSATISWQRSLNDAVPRQPITPGSEFITITNGVVSTSLLPNSVMLPPGTCYTISYTLNGVKSVRYWYVPASATPVNLDVVEGTIPCPTQTGVLISPSQISGANAQLGYVLAWNGSYYAPAASGGGSAGNPGGTNGSLQVNNLGAFGGFIVGGDCVLTQPNFICTKTNGVAFAPSATSDTTNAANIVSGLLPNARGGTGSGTSFTPGSIVFAGTAGAYQQDNTNLFWSFSAHALGIGTTTPIANLDIRGGSGVQLNLKAAPASNTNLFMQDGNSMNNWGLAATISGTWTIYDQTHNVSPVVVYPGGVNNSLTLWPSGDLIVGAATSDGNYRLDVQNSGTSGSMRIFDQTPTTGSTGLLVMAGAGQSSTPMITVEDNTGNPLSQIGPDGSFASLVGGGRALVVGVTLMGLGSNSRIVFRDNPSFDLGSADVGIQRSGPGLLEVNSGTLGSWRDLKVRSLSTTGLSGAGAQCVSVDNTGLLSIAGTGPCFAGSALGIYSQAITSQTSVTISAATHARGVTPLATCLDNSSPRNVVVCAYTRDSSGNLAFSFNPQFSGVIEVRQ